MNHDPLCWSWTSERNGEAHPECQCEFIATVRNDMLATAIASVEYLHDHEAPHDAHKDALWNAITALRALQEKP
jgi:hypothetical protein